MIPDSILFYPVGGGDPFDFFQSGLTTVRVFSAKIAPRGSSRARLNGHGRHPRAALFSGLDIHQEGIIFNGDLATAGAVRDAMLAAILGDVTGPPAAIKLGELRVKKVGWSEYAAGDVVLDDYDAPLVHDPGNVQEYMLQWACADPFFVGVTSSAIYRL